ETEVHKARQPILKDNIPTPIFTVAEKESCAGAEDSDSPLYLQQGEHCLYKRLKYIAGTASVSPIDIALAWMRRLAERRIHQHRVVTLAAEVDEGEPAGRILSEQSAADRPAVFRLFGIVLQGVQN